MAMNKTSETEQSEESNDSNKDGLPKNSGNQSKNQLSDQVREINGPKGPEPTRYGDWDVNGRCTDF